MNRQMASGTDKTIEVDGKRQCSNCGTCCSAILCVSKAELLRIHRYLRKHPEVKLTNYNDAVSKDFKDICPFLTEENKCGIYDYRPEICRHFICSNYLSQGAPPMDHRGKTIVNMITEFMPESPCPSAPDLTEVNKFYEQKKELVYGKKK